MPLFFLREFANSAGSIFHLSFIVAISQQRRQEQQAAPTTVLGTVRELRRLNADSNQRNFVVDCSFVAPVNDNEEFADLLDGYEVNPNIGLSMEVITEGPGIIGSVKITFNGIAIVENNAPFALCANSGADFLPCTGLNSGRDDQRITAQVYSGKGATGTTGPVLYYQ